MTARAPEAQLKQTVLTTLKRLGIWAMGNAINARGKYRAGLEDGSPDVICILPPLGCLLGLELKVDTKQRPAQKEWQTKHEALGGEYAIVCTVQEAVDAVTKARAEIRRKMTNARVTQ